MIARESAFVNTLLKLFFYIIYPKKTFSRHACIASISRGEAAYHATQSHITRRSRISRGNAVYHATQSHITLATQAYHVTQSHITRRSRISRGEAAYHATKSHIVAYHATQSHIAAYHACIASISRISAISSGSTFLTRRSKLTRPLISSSTSLSWVYTAAHRPHALAGITSSR